MAKLLGPDFFSLQVRDIKASKKFYTEVLGLPVDPEFDTPGFIAFDTTSIPFALRQAPEATDKTVKPGSGVQIWLDCDNVDELAAKLEAAGTTLIKPPSERPFGRNVVFADPDGYQITANHNPWERFPLGGRKKD